LRAAGAHVEEVVAYRTLSREPKEILAAWPAPDPDAAIVASPSAARALISGLGVERLARLRALIAIGPTTAEAIADAGLVAAIPHQATFEAAAALAAELLDADETEPSKPVAATLAARKGGRP
jgi:uroporphyrinogen-III synthase